MQRTSRPSSPGFTLIELMVVVSIIVVLVAITVPTLSIMRRQSAESVAVSTVQIAGATARGYSNRPDRAFLTDLVSLPSGGPSESGVYSGYAVIFLPHGEARIVENLEGALDHLGRHLERVDDAFTFNADSGNPLGGNDNVGEVPSHLNGFIDGPIQEGKIEPIRFPADAGYAGIVAPSPNVNDAPKFIPPPFAVWYDENGQLVTGDNGDPSKCVYYDGDYDGSYEYNSVRPNGYNPNEYDPSSPDFDQGLAVSPANDRFIVPFERLETVVGIWTYSKDRYRAAVEAGQVAPWTNMTQSAMNDRQEWFRENGSLVMFSRQAGTPMRSSDE